MSALIDSIFTAISASLLSRGHRLFRDVSLSGRCTHCFESFRTVSLCYVVAALFNNQRSADKRADSLSDILLSPHGVSD